MSYTFDKILDGLSFNDATSKVTEVLQERGFGLLSSIDVQKTIREKINKYIPRYTILGVCSPQHAFRALSLEDKIGSMLPCNVVLQERENNRIEVSAIDPVASMSAINNPQLLDVALEVRSLLEKAINAL